MADTETRIQEFLDSLSQLPGSILYRDTNEWKALAPGAEGQALSLNESLRPNWTDLQQGAPALMAFDGGHPYFYRANKAWTNKTINIVARFRASPTTLQRPLCHGYDPTGSLYGIHINSNGTMRVAVWNAARAVCCYLTSAASFEDGNLHSLTFHYDPTTGTAEFIIDHQDVDDPTFAGRVLTTASLPAVGSVQHRLGYHTWNTYRWLGSIGFYGIRQGGKISHSDFFKTNNLPKQIDETGWTEWKGQPLAWHESAQMNQSLGSDGLWTEYGNCALTPFATWT